MMAIKNIVSLIIAVVMVCFAANAHANNLQISNLNVASVDTASGTMTFTCDVTQDNAWKNTTNHDAAWVFMKYSTDGGLTWNHASMNGYGTNPAGFSAPQNFQLVVPVDGRGFFLQKTNFGSGSISASGVKFVWNYAQDGVTAAVAQAANTIHKTFGIEMVYVPQGAFYAGDGASSSEYAFKQGSADSNPWYVQNENAITTTNSASAGFYYQSTGATGENATGSTFLIPASYPKGFGAFYLMKYELTEGEYVAFFNTLSSAAKARRDLSSATLGGKNSDGVVNRNTISWDSTNPTSKAITSRPSRPVSFIGWPDVAAYASWAGLRPMTELEFEKAARGKDIMPLVDEFAWGTASYTPAGATDISPDSDENGSETISNSAANLSRNDLGYNTGDGRVAGIAAGQAGPLRAGIFSATASNRISAGAGFYGNMELSGNLAEPVVTLGRTQGRQFLGSHGTGALTTLSGYEGNASNTDWPGIDSTNANRGITGTKGIGYRGGDFASSNIRAFQLSSRTYAVKDPDSEGFLQRYDAANGVFQGGRLARTAP
jgi:formylglycine-generating enzyme required for sulfatase activity